jgi:hypothetical protein
VKRRYPAVVLACSLVSAALGATAPEMPTTIPVARAGEKLAPNLAENIDRPLRYRPENGDFVITNGAESFNRPLYGGSSAFRVDGGDRPEFSLYLPGRGGVLRLAVVTLTGGWWLSDAAEITTRYRAGTLVYSIRDPRLGDGTLELTALAARATEALVLRIEWRGVKPLDLAAVLGGLTGERGRRDGDLGTESAPVRDYFRFRPEHAAGNTFELTPSGFALRAPKAAVNAVLPLGTAAFAAEAGDDPVALLQAATNAPRPVGVGRFTVVPGTAAHLALQRAAPDTLAPTPDSLASLFTREQSALTALARRVVIATPDPFLDAVAPALNIAADAVWDDRQQAYLHGAVAWRIRLLGWRVSYAGDALGWPERTRAHFDGDAAKQNNAPIPATFPPIAAADNLARHEDALHSNGDLTNSHYDMNLVAIDAILRHLRWTGDLAYARRIWPVLERSLAWERRLFRREFGPERLPLYEAYAAIWASDDLAYSGGGATHATAYNLLHHREAARLARLLGFDATPYEREADAITRGLAQQLWLPREGWFAESRDLLGRQLIHPAAAAWTVYHAVDSQVASPQQAWQLGRYADTALPRFPVRGEGVPPGNHTIATTTWHPYTWSINNVVFAEAAHTALAQWQAGRVDSAVRLFRGAVLTSLFIGACPGNLGMTTSFDVYRRESQRDFGDGIGITSRALIEGLFGVQPDLLDGAVIVRPGFPADWEHACLTHPQFDFSFRRTGATDRYEFTARFARAAGLRLELPARGADAVVTLNGQPHPWRADPEAVGTPRLQLDAPVADRFVVEITWRGPPPPAPPPEQPASPAAAISLEAGASVRALVDPQGTLADPSFAGHSVRGRVTGLPGHRTLFAQVELGVFRWWQPLELDVRAAPARPPVFTTDWSQPLPAATHHDAVSLGGVFNDRISALFRHDYLRPRSPFVSLALARNGYGTWTHPADAFDVDDRGLRAIAAAHGDTLRLPNGVPLATPGAADAPNVAFVSQWENFPQEISAPLTGRARKVYLLMAGSTHAMQSRLDNGEVVVTYRDGTTTRLALENPTTWWPIDQDYFVDDFAFARDGGLPVRVDLRSGAVRVLDPAKFRGQGRKVPGGAATVLDLTLDPERELQSLTVRALANDVVIGLLSATLERP